MDPISAALILGKVKSFFGRLFSNKWFWIVLGAALLTFAGYRIFNHYVENKVETAVTDDRKGTTIDTYRAQDRVGEAVAPIDRKHDIIRQQTQQEYSNVRAQIKAAPSAEREAPAPDIIIDTLNALGGMRRGAEPNGVPQAADPVG